MKLVRVSSEEFMETLDQSVELFKKYQIAVHNDEEDECDKQSFLNFLGKTPLKVIILSFVDCILFVFGLEYFLLAGN